MTPFVGRRYDRPQVGGVVIPAGSNKSDFEALEAAVAGLVAEFRRVSKEKSELELTLDERDRTIHSLEGKVRELNQRRQDVSKRIDDLITQIDHMDGQRGAVAAAAK